MLAGLSSLRVDDLCVLAHELKAEYSVVLDREEAKNTGCVQECL